MSYGNVNTSEEFTISEFEESDFNKLFEDDIKNVSDCLRLNSGHVMVQGSIVSISKLYKLVDSADYDCLQCGSGDSVDFDPPIDISSYNHIKSNTRFSKVCKCNESIMPSYNYVNAVTIELQDRNTFSDIEKLTCILFNDDTKDIRVGENVIISGNIHIITRNKKSISCLYSTTLNYENQENMELTDLDIQAIRRVVKRKGEGLVNWLSSNLFATSIIGFDIIKKGLLLSAVSSGVDIRTDNGIENRNRLHTIIVGDPGTGKSKFLKECSKLIPNSRYESGQHSSGKSLTAIVSRENEEYFLRIGSIPLSHGSLCALNEIGRMNFEDQGFLLDVMEEGSFTINKHGINAKINSSTVIVASSNPMGSTWKKPYRNNDDTVYEGNSNNFNKNGDSYDDKIDLSNIPVLNPILDRFDLVFIIRNMNSEEDNREYANIKTNQISDPKRIPSYNPYLKKHLQYSKKINPVLNDEAKTIINEFYVKLSSSSSFYYGSSKRALEKLIRIAKTISQLKLKDRVDSNDAKEALEFFNAVICHYESSVISIPKNPKDRTIELFAEILKNSAFPFSLEELVKEACKRDEYISSYLVGSSEYKKSNKNKFKMENNKKLRNAYDVLIDDPNIQLVSSKPVVLKYSKNVSDPNDPSDSKLFNFQTTKSNEINEKVSNSITPCNGIRYGEESDRSDRSDSSDSSCIQKEINLSNKIDKKNVDPSQHHNLSSQLKLKHSPNAEISTNETENLDELNNHSTVSCNEYHDECLS